jgi:hypothetical protein
VFADANPEAPVTGLEHHLAWPVDSVATGPRGCGRGRHQVVASPVLPDELEDILVEKFGVLGRGGKGGRQRSRAAVLMTVLTKGVGGRNLDPGAEQHIL